MITFTISKDDFRRMIHGRRIVEVDATLHNRRQLGYSIALGKRRHAVYLQDASEPMRSRLVQINDFFMGSNRDKLIVKIKMLYE